MGWCSGLPGHEGYLVAVVQDAKGAWRELGYSVHDVEPRERVETVQVACDCGWRSARRYAPAGTSYAPYVVICTATSFEERCRAEWLEHVASEERRRRRDPESARHTP